MGAPMGEDALRVVLQCFRALADSRRLRLLGILAERECSTAELAGRLGLTPPAVSHHLGTLKALGLVRLRQEGTTQRYALDEVALRGLSRDVLTPERMRSLADDVQGGAWERKVLRDLFEGERLKEIPTVNRQHGRRKLDVVLRWLAGRFQPGVRYTEPEVNEVLKRHHPDTATLRRELVAPGRGLMRRERGVYWRAGATEVAEAGA